MSVTPRAVKGARHDNHIRNQWRHQHKRHGYYTVTRLKFCLAARPMQRPYRAGAQSWSISAALPVVPWFLTMVPRRYLGRRNLQLY